MFVSDAGTNKKDNPGVLKLGSQLVNANLDVNLTKDHALAPIKRTQIRVLDQVDHMISMSKWWKSLIILSSADFPEPSIIEAIHIAACDHAICMQNKHHKSIGMKMSSRDAPEADSCRAWPTTQSGNYPSTNSNGLAGEMAISRLANTRAILKGMTRGSFNHMKTFSAFFFQRCWMLPQTSKLKIIQMFAEHCIFLQLKSPLKSSQGQIILAVFTDPRSIFLLYC